MDKEELDNKLSLFIDNIMECTKKIDETIDDIQSFKDACNEIKVMVEKDVSLAINPEGKNVYSNQTKRDIETDARLKVNRVYLEKQHIIEGLNKIMRSLGYDLTKNKYLFRKYETLSRS